MISDDEGLFGSVYEPGVIVFRQDEPGDAMYVIQSGAVEYSYRQGDTETVLTVLEKGDFFSESEIITEQARTASATATTHAQVMPIDRNEFISRIQTRPELALFMLQALSVRLQNIGAVLDNPKAPVDAVRQRWRPLLPKQERAKVAIVSLSTCAGCSAVFLDQEILADVLEAADIVYCPMLMDQGRLVEADVALVDGAVRLREDEEKLQEARRKSRLVVAWGTCASFGGIPAHANRYELEDLIQETYGQTYDAYAYYLSGSGGVVQETYQEEGIELLRKAYELDDFVRVDYYVPGCPPVPGHLLRLLGELTGQSFKGAKAIVCAECGRRPNKDAVTALGGFPHQEVEGVCFHSLGALCLGFLTRGGCGGACTRNMLPCWGCRGPANVALKKMAGGDSFEEVVISRLVRRCRMEEQQLKPAVKLLRQQGHSLFDFERNFLSSLSRVR